MFFMKARVQMTSDAFTRPVGFAVPPYPRTIACPNTTSTSVPACAPVLM